MMLTIYHNDYDGDDDDDDEDDDDDDDDDPVPGCCMRLSVPNGRLHVCTVCYCMEKEA